MDLFLDEHTELVLLILSFSSFKESIRFSQTCRRASRLVQDDERVWERGLKEQPNLVSTLRLPECFSARRKIELAGKELQMLQAEKSKLEKDFLASSGAGPEQRFIKELFDFVRKSKEPLHDGSSNPYLKDSKKSKQGSHDDKAISKMLLQSSKISTGSKVLLLSSDPQLLTALALQATDYRPQGGYNAATERDVESMRSMVRLSVLRTVQVVAREADPERLGRESSRVARAVLAATCNDEGFAEVGASLPLLWSDERMRQAAVARRERMQRTSARRSLAQQMEEAAVERLLGPDRWPDVISEDYKPTPKDTAIIAVRGGLRESVIVSKGFRVRLLDASALLLTCKRSKIVSMFDDMELVVLGLDVGPRLPGRLATDESFGLFEQMKLYEALVSSKWFKKTLTTLLVNVEGIEEALQSVQQQQTASGGTEQQHQQDTARSLKFLKTRLKVISRNPQQLSVMNIRFVQPSKDQKLIEPIIRTIADLFLARNVQKGF